MIGAAVAASHRRPRWRRRRADRGPGNPARARGPRTPRRRSRRAKRKRALAQQSAELALARADAAHQLDGAGVVAPGQLEAIGGVRDRSGRGRRPPWRSRSSRRPRWCPSPVRLQISFSFWTAAMLSISRFEPFRLVGLVLEPALLDARVRALFDLHDAAAADDAVAAVVTAGQDAVAHRGARRSSRRLGPVVLLPVLDRPVAHLVVGRDAAGGAQRAEALGSR